jgi:hypothetical protein
MYEIFKCQNILTKRRDRLHFSSWSRVEEERFAPNPDGRAISEVCRYPDFPVAGLFDYRIHIIPYGGRIPYPNGGPNDKSLFMDYQKHVFEPWAAVAHRQ